VSMGKHQATVPPEPEPVVAPAPEPVVETPAQLLETSSKRRKGR
jgi:hypothetical protein